MGDSGRPPFASAQPPEAGKSDINPPYRPVYAPLTPLARPTGALRLNHLITDPRGYGEFYHLHGQCPPRNQRLFPQPPQQQQYQLIDPYGRVTMRPFASQCPPVSHQPAAPCRKRAPAERNTAIDPNDFRPPALQRPPSLLCQPAVSNPTKTGRRLKKKRLVPQVDSLPYIMLVWLALWNAKAPLHVKSIYRFVATHFPGSVRSSWENSLRENVSRKSNRNWFEKAPSLIGRGAQWKIKNGSRALFMDKLRRWMAKGKDERHMGMANPADWDAILQGAKGIPDEDIYEQKKTEKAVHDALYAIPVEEGEESDWEEDAEEPSTKRFKEDSGSGVDVERWEDEKPQFTQMEPVLLPTQMEVRDAEEESSWEDDDDWDDDAEEPPVVIIKEEPDDEEYVEEEEPHEPQFTQMESVRYDAEEPEKNGNDVTFGTWEEHETHEPEEWDPDSPAADPSLYQNYLPDCPFATGPDNIFDD